MEWWAIEEGVRAESTEHIRELEEALHRAMEQARRLETLENELSKARGSLKTGETLAKGQAKKIMDLEV